MDPHDKRIIHSSEEPNWRTPPECVVALHEEFGFCLDAAANETDHVLPHWFGPGSNMGAEDALKVSWSAMVKTLDYQGPIFLNPPYSKKAKMPIEPWLRKCWEESQQGCTIVALIPFSPQTSWYRQYVYGHCIPVGAPVGAEYSWSGHAAREERRIPHRISYNRPDGSPAGNAGVNTAIIVWKPSKGIVGPWMPHQFYWSYR